MGNTALRNGGFIGTEVDVFRTNENRKFIMLVVMSLTMEASESGDGNALKVPSTSSAMAASADA